MTDYIARESVREVLLNPAVRGIGFTEYELDKIPMADVEPVRHGRWEANEKGFIYCAGQDGCGYVRIGIPLIEYMPYCPNCGARMDLEVSE